MHLSVKTPNLSRMKLTRCHVRGMIIGLRSHHVQYEPIVAEQIRPLLGVELSVCS